MIVDLSNDQIELLLYCLEQQEYEFIAAEQADCAAIIDKFTTAQAADN
jgi:hypothetical protein